MLKHRVISVCFRGHGPNRDPVQDFSFADHARDVLAILDDLSVDRFVCIAASHGAWSALGIAQMMGWQRMPAVLILDLAMEELLQQLWRRSRAYRTQRPGDRVGLVQKLGQRWYAGYQGDRAGSAQPRGLQRRDMGAGRPDNRGGLWHMGHAFKAYRSIIGSAPDPPRL
jgi:pimeloyl-ACP methyl ester carboxylesterase